MSYKLGKRSLSRLEGVDCDLVAVVKRAIQITEIDFTVLEGVRSIERQRKLVASGASQTMNSKHIPGDAVDIAPFVDGRVSWDWPLYYKLAEAMVLAAKELDVDIRWGGCWKPLDSITDPQEAVAEYVARKRSQGKKAFMDGPHYERIK